MKSTTVIGVDAGKSGAAAAYNVAANSFDVIDLPLDSERDLDAVAFYSWMCKFDPSYLVVEDCWQPLTLIRMCGEIAAVGKLAGAVVERIAVCTWKIDMLGVNSSDKELSLKKCKQLRPEINLLKTPRAKKPSADRAEAVLLALYAAKIYGVETAHP